MLLCRYFDIWEATKTFLVCKYGSDVREELPVDGDVCGKTPFAGPVGQLKWQFE